MLFNSVGVMSPPIEQETKQGYDMQSGTNVPRSRIPYETAPPHSLRHCKILPRRTCARHQHVFKWASKGRPRWYRVGHLGGWTSSPKEGYSAQYFQSKWANVVYAKEHARRYRGMRIVSTGLDPGTSVPIYGATRGDSSAAFFSLLFCTTLSMGH